ncbi:hypothetical protein R1flu_006473 [Riccia fluitans]|uniref:AAA+ ATPase domain-containing protein n=1 Tax=Riccia fluitans TaxID=41844 RepID=A0ABD1YX59_9MARC
MPLFSQSSENVTDGEPSVTRWSFQDFEQAYEMKFASKWFKSCSPTESEPMANGEPEVAQNGGPTTDGNGVVSRNKIPQSTAVYEHYLNKKNGETPEVNGTSPHGRTKLWPPKPLPDFGSPEVNELAQSITRDILRDTSDVKWENIKGLENAKRLMKEAVVMPIKYPQYFKGLLSPWKGILLFGPPGTGKTMLAKAVASECNTTFFNISASSIVSKWRGDSEKLVKVLFELARHFAPSTIFLDEIDAIISQRGDGRSEHEASRRLKTELLVQMDGLNKSTDLVFLLAATNLPWELDAAMLRRLEKRILVPLPEPEARRSMCEELLPKGDNPDLPYDDMVEMTEGYSGSDIRIVCKEAAMRPLRRLMADLEHIEQSGVPASEEDLPKIGAITDEDVRIALETTRPSAHLLAARYEQFDADFGSRAV